MTNCNGAGLDTVFLDVAHTSQVWIKRRTVEDGPGQKKLWRHFVVLPLRLGKELAVAGNNMVSTLLVLPKDSTHAIGTGVVSRTNGSVNGLKSG